MRTKMIGVNIQHGEVKFRYNNGLSRALNEPEAVEFLKRYEISGGISPALQAGQGVTWRISVFTRGHRAHR